MPEFWLDTDSLITPSRGPYAFDIAPGFWTFLEANGTEGIISSSHLVYDELLEGEDELKEWAKQQNDKGFFVEPDQSVQDAFREIADYVNNTYSSHQASQFLDGADPWIIAQAKAHGGRVVTFEVRAPNSTKPKIPDICDRFDVRTLNLWELLKELSALFS